LVMMVLVSLSSVRLMSLGSTRGGEVHSEDWVLLW
jgi:hypothetical protein